MHVLRYVPTLYACLRLSVSSSPWAHPSLFPGRRRHVCSLRAGSMSYPTKTPFPISYWVFVESRGWLATAACEREIFGYYHVNRPNPRPAMCIG